MSLVLRIRTLWSRAGPLTPDRAKQLDEPLYRSALKTYGGWFDALREADLPWEEVAPASGRWRHGRKRITEDEVMQSIRERALRGYSVARKDFPDKSVVRAAVVIYGSWPAALLIAGIPAEELPKCKATAALTVLVLRQLLARGLKTSRAVEAAGHRRWAKAGLTWFGSWQAALEKAAQMPLERPLLQVQLQSRLVWSPAHLLEELRKLAPEGRLPARAVRADPACRAAVTAHFRTLAAAAQAAGVELCDVRHSSYTKKSVLTQLREKAREGYVLHADLTPGLPRAAARLFGSYPKACELAGVKPVNNRWHAAALRPPVEPPPPTPPHQPLPPDAAEITYAQAAAAAGCCVKTVQSALRAGRLVSAGRQLLTRVSVEAWLKGLGLAEGPDWIPTREAAKAAGLARGNVLAAGQQGLFRFQKTARGRVLIERTSFEAWLRQRHPPAEEHPGLTVAQACELTGVGRTAILQAIWRGELASVRTREGHRILPGALPPWIAERQARFRSRPELKGERLTVKAAALRFGVCLSHLQRAVGDGRLAAELEPCQGGFRYVVGADDVAAFLGVHDLTVQRACELTGLRAPVLRRAYRSLVRDPEARQPGIDVTLLEEWLDRDAPPYRPEVLGLPPLLTPQDVARELGLPLQTVLNALEGRYLIPLAHRIPRYQVDRWAEQRGLTRSYVPPLLLVAHASKLTGIPMHTLQGLIAKGRLDAVREGRHWLIRRPSLDRLVSERDAR